MEKYEAPTMKFEKITFFEKIANPCWAHNSLHIDVPCTEHDILITLGHQTNPSGNSNNGCGKAFIKKIEIEYSDKVIGSSCYDKYFEGNHSRNYANTQLKGWSGS